MGRNISPLESKYLKEENKRRLYLDCMGDAVFTTLTLQSLSAVNTSQYSDSVLYFLALGVLGTYVYLNDTLKRKAEFDNLNDNYTELYSEEETMKLVRRK